MSMEAFKPAIEYQAAGTSALNLTAGSTTATTAIKGPVIFLSVHSYGVYVRFVKSLADTVTSTNGMRLPANTVIRLGVPEDTGFLAYIRDASNDAAISIQAGVGV
jgi:hypothetical protein